ncbi:hypothetical protein [Piscirickettsia litoralis]|uniref:Uncharacterized protein n=1 Tax=Piscirickettsia litoralis TaxID=1891921 RepID=A0ABX3A0N8_9GAMM|nr:hypothetical protein [Piscirickettsia litoralis]ODN41020.1 hypothetical protein BGC07_18485 [Piscirickettsia litoralis]
MIRESKGFVEQANHQVDKILDLVRDTIMTDADNMTDLCDQVSYIVYSLNKIVGLFISFQLDSAAQVSEEMRKEVFNVIHNSLLRKMKITRISSGSINDGVIQ